MWSVYTSEPHSLVRNSHQNYSDNVYFRSYRTISVSVRINAKFRQCTVMRMAADALFSKTVFNCSSGLLPSFILRYICLPKLYSVLCRIPKANLHLGKLKILSYVILYPP